MKYNYVSDLMSKPAITCEYNTTFKETIEIMKTKDIGFLPVTKKGVLVGVVTDRDLLIRGIGTYKLNTRIDRVMTSGDVRFVDPGTSLKEAARIMALYKIRRLPVLKDGECVGVITTKNLLNVDELFPYIKETYLNTSNYKEYEMSANSNPHDSLKASDYPL